MLSDLNVLRNENSELKMQNGLMRDLEERFAQLGRDSDQQFEENNRLRNEVSLLKG